MFVGILDPRQDNEAEFSQCDFNHLILHGNDIEPNFYRKYYKKTIKVYESPRDLFKFLDMMVEYIDRILKEN